MQTLGLASKPQPADNIFKRLFWPAIESQYDVDLLGQQGFWVCAIVALVSLVVMIVLGTPVTGLFSALVFFLGGCGVRQRSVAAAAMVFALYLINWAGAIVIGTVGNPLVPLVILMLLFANVRATAMSRRWMAKPVDSVDQEFPERSTETVTDRFANKLPAAVWPRSRYVFFPLAGILLLLTIVGVAVMKRRAAERPASGSSTTTLEVSPS